MQFILRAVGCLVAIIAFSGSRCPCFAEEKPQAKPAGNIELGIPESLFHRIPKIIQHVAAEPFLKLLKEQSGLDGNLQVLPDAMTLAGQLNENKIQIGIFQGYEFASAQLEYPDLIPLVVATPPEIFQSYCLVRWDNPAKSITDLKGKTISLPSKPDRASACICPI